MTEVKRGRPPRGWRSVFLDALKASANVRYACTRAQVSRRTAYRTYDANPAFAEAWDDAIDEACDDLELEARRRAMEGVERTEVMRTGADPTTGKPVFEKVVRREYSDTLMLALLRAHRPERFREGYDIRPIVATATAEPADGGQAGA